MGDGMWIIKGVGVMRSGREKASGCPCNQFGNLGGKVLLQRMT